MVVAVEEVKAAIFFSSGMSSAMMGATSSRMSSDVPASLRLCASSPICSSLAMSTLTSISPLSFIASRSTG